MPKSTKDKLKTRLAQSLNMLDRSNKYLVEVFTVFAKQHPEHTEALDLIITNQLQGKEFILKFWQLAWGKRPEDYRKWLPHLKRDD